MTKRSVGYTCMHFLADGRVPFHVGEICRDIEDIPEIWKHLSKETRKGCSFIVVLETWKGLLHRRVGVGGCGKERRISIGPW